MSLKQVRGVNVKVDCSCSHYNNIKDVDWTPVARFKAVGGHLHLLTLKQLKKKYPDEEFFPSPENSCQDAPTYK